MTSLTRSSAPRASSVRSTQRARIRERLGRHRVADVDQEHRANLVRLGGAHEASEPEREQRQKGEPQHHAQHALRPGQIGERSAEHEQQERRDEQHAEHARLEQRVSRPVSRPFELVRSGQDEAAVGEKQSDPDRDDQRSPERSAHALAHSAVLPLRCGERLISGSDVEAAFRIGEPGICGVGAGPQCSHGIVNARAPTAQSRAISGI